MVWSMFCCSLWWTIQGCRKKADSSLPRFQHSPTHPSNPLIPPRSGLITDASSQACICVRLWPYWLGSVPLKVMHLQSFPSCFPACLERSLPYLSSGPILLGSVPSPPGGLDCPWHIHNCGLILFLSVRYRAEDIEGYEKDRERVSTYIMKEIYCKKGLLNVSLCHTISHCLSLCLYLSFQKSFRYFYS